MKNFTDIGINNELVCILESQNFIHPTPIQEKAIPLILEGRDIIGQAETGSGKTAACGIPIIQRIDKNINNIQALILTPTRELALQYLNEISAIGIPYGVKPFVVYGGFDIDIQLAKLKSGVQILVATPGRLMDIIYNHQLSFGAVKTFVIDEADEMLKMGFIEDVSFIKSCIIQEHQTLLFSATMPGPIRCLTKEYMKDTLHIRLNHKRVQPKTLTHLVAQVDSRDKDKALKSILVKENISQAIIFCNTRSRVSDVFKNLGNAVKNIDFLHGGLEQNLRTRIVDKFRQKKIKFLITTDVMARGMDVQGVSHIINYDIPRNPETYIHRSGRTARLGKYGTSISFVTHKDLPAFNEIKSAAAIRPLPVKLEICRSSCRKPYRNRQKRSRRNAD